MSAPLLCCFRWRWINNPVVCGAWQAWSDGSTPKSCSSCSYDCYFAVNVTGRLRFSADYTQIKDTTTAESPSQQEFTSFLFYEQLFQTEMLNALKAFAETLQRLLQCFMYFLVAKNAKHHCISFFFFLFLNRCIKNTFGKSTGSVHHEGTVLNWKQPLSQRYNQGSDFGGVPWNAWQISVMGERKENYGDGSIFVRKKYGCWLTCKVPQDLWGWRILAKFAWSVLTAAWIPRGNALSQFAVLPDLRLRVCNPNYPVRAVQNIPPVKM